MLERDWRRNTDQVGGRRGGSRILVRGQRSFDSRGAWAQSLPKNAWELHDFQKSWGQGAPGPNTPLDPLVGRGNTIWGGESFCSVCSEWIFFFFNFFVCSATLAMQGQYMRKGPACLSQREVIVSRLDTFTLGVLYTKKPCSLEVNLFSLDEAFPRMQGTLEHQQVQQSFLCFPSPCRGRAFTQKENIPFFCKKESKSEFSSPWNSFLFLFDRLSACRFLFMGLPWKRTKWFRCVHIGWYIFCQAKSKIPQLLVFSTSACSWFEFAKKVRKKKKEKKRKHRSRRRKSDPFLLLPKNKRTWVVQQSHLRTLLQALRV